MVLGFWVVLWGLGLGRFFWGGVFGVWGGWVLCGFVRGKFFGDLVGDVILGGGGLVLCLLGLGLVLDLGGGASVVWCFYSVVFGGGGVSVLIESEWVVALWFVRLLWGGVFSGVVNLRCVVGGGFFFESGEERGGVCRFSYLKVW